MNSVTRSRLAWGIAIGSIVCAAGSMVFQAVVVGGSDDPALFVIAMIATVAYGFVGATIAARTGNAVGWALLSVIAAWAVSIGTQTYATYSYVDAAHPLPLADFTAWVGTLAFFLTLALVLAVPLLFPTGTPRWRWVWWTYVASTAVMVCGFAILPQELGLGTNDVPGPQNPFAIHALEPVVSPLLAVAGLALVFCAVMAIVGLILRYRGSHGDERQQVRWLAYLGLATVAAFVLNLVANAVLGEQTTSQPARFILVSTADLFFAIVVIGIPVACGVAILRYRLYDLDVVVRKTVVFGLLAVFISAVFVAVVGGVGALVGSTGNTSLAFVAAAVLALAFQPARERARRVADRLVYGVRATPYEVLAEFSERVGEAYASEDVLPRMAHVLASGTGAASATVWLRVGGQIQPVATYPDGAEPGREHAVDVVHRGEALGELSVTMPPSDPMNPAKGKLIRDLAAQAGLVLRNVRLIEELRASRQRLVAAQDEERRRLERDLHDGAQQQLVALSVQLKIAEQLAGRDPVKERELLAKLGSQANAALEDLRDLARGIYPPLLADKGLTAALEAQARKAAVRTTVESNGIGRYAQDVEAAVYFCTLEALNNVAKYANASAAVVRLEHTNGDLTFSVDDDGEGFDVGSTEYGTGLQGMADRLEAIGGSLTIVSEPGAGTKVEGRVQRLGPIDGRGSR